MNAIHRSRGLPLKSYEPVAKLSRLNLCQLVRETLERHGGECSRGELLAAILAEGTEAKRLARGQGFARLLANMKHSGFVELEGSIVRRTSRRVGHRHV